MKRSHEAGRSAQQRYDDMASAWRRRRYGRARWLVWLAVAASVPFAYLPAPWAYFVGMLAGVVIMGWVALNEMVPRHIERWWQGAEGERQTEKLLRPLTKQGWVVAHDLQARYGNIDHMLVGPPGVFILDSKRWSGEVHVDGDIATVTPIEDPTAAWSWPRLPGSIRRTCAANHEAIRKLTGQAVWVNGVIVVWAPFQQRLVQANNVTYVHGDELVSWLMGQPTRLNPAQIQRVATVIGGTNSV